MSVTSNQQKPPSEEFHTVAADLQLRDTLRERFKEENQFLVNVLGFLLRGIDYIRKSNYSDLNIIAVGKNVTSTNLSDCKISRYLKYLAFEFAQAVRKRQEERYQEYLEE